MSEKKIEITQKEMFFQRNVLNPYPTESQSHTAYKKGFEECFNTFFAASQPPAAKDPEQPFTGNTSSSGWLPSMHAPDELWDEFSRHIDDDIDSLSTIAGSSVITEKDFKELMKRVQTPVVGAVWVKATNWPEGKHNEVHWRRVEDKLPLLIVGRNYQNNIIAQFGKVYTPDQLEWLDESPTAAGDGMEAMEFANWIHSTGYFSGLKDETWVSGTDDRSTTAELYNIFKHQNK